KVFNDKKLILGLLIFWFLLTGKFTLYNSIVGISIVLFIVYISDVILGDDNQMSGKIKASNFFKFTFFVIVDIYKASLTHMIKIIKNKSKPIVIHVKLETNNSFIASLISNAITLTPGTITLEIEENSKLKVLTIIEKEEEIEKIKKNIIRRYEKVLTKGLER
ncbi:MAG: Na+/H+ antiporter subunit E, partial [Bacillota bacterium]|nr:Na+/H+ antiporter subunit E [Bacillota bacterium]